MRPKRCDLQEDGSIDSVSPCPVHWQAMAMPTSAVATFYRRCVGVGILYNSGKVESGGTALGEQPTPQQQALPTSSTPFEPSGSKLMLSKWQRRSWQWDRGSWWRTLPTLVTTLSSTISCPNQWLSWCPLPSGRLAKKRHQGLKIMHPWRSLACSNKPLGPHPRKVLRHLSGGGMMVHMMAPSRPEDGMKILYDRQEGYRGDIEVWEKGEGSCKKL